MDSVVRLPAAPPSPWTTLRPATEKGNVQGHRFFSNVISLSGSFWWKPRENVEWEWLTRQFALKPWLPLRFYIEVGLLESGPTATGFPGQLLSNRHLRTVLQARRYEVHYEEQMHGHDSALWQTVLHQALVALVK